MKRVTVLTAHRAFSTGLVVLLSWMLVSPVRVEAQQGNNAVWGSGSTPTGSAAFIDASAFLPATNPPDICQVLYNIISSASYPTNGAVIDARGINAANSKDDAISGDMTCAGTPWLDGSASTTKPATILLPAGYQLMGGGVGNIIVYQPWILPNGSKIIGEGPNPGKSQNAPAFATLQAASTFSGSAMIEMGSSSSPFACPLVNSAYVCTGIAVEHITLEASSLSIDGIDNAYAQEGSFVNDVNFVDVGGTGLYVSAPNSGPYSEINFAAAAIGSICATLAAETLGIHGATCIGDNSTHASTTAAIYVNASNNSIEDVHAEGFQDGVRIGDIASITVGNIVVSNVTGAPSMAGPVINTVHICGANTNSTFGTCVNKIGNQTVQDVVILQATDQGNNGGTATAIQDDVTGTSITPLSGTFATAGMYILV